MRKMSRLVVSACGRDPPFLFFHVKHGLRTVVRACGRDPPLFFISA